MEKITLCGDNCLYCPRYTAKTDKDLSDTAELWHKIGWRNIIVSNEEIKCTGCSSSKQCTYQLVECIKLHGVKNTANVPNFHAIKQRICCCALKNTG
ncbi:MAG: DUF3795 domain-containing protein, partial [Ruminococcus sp.]|nr:DUF3795 domain-containing protein [Ruminococcus sp.]